VRLAHQMRIQFPDLSSDWLVEIVDETGGGGPLGVMPTFRPVLHRIPHFRPIAIERAPGPKPI
jgi:hypothetical protein